MVGKGMVTWSFPWMGGTVDGSGFSGGKTNQLIQLVVSPIIYDRFLYIPVGHIAGFLKHQE